MLTSKTIAPIDYLVIGHIAKDLIPAGYRIGGTVAYSGLTAKALGMKTGILTSCSNDLDLSPLDGISIHIIPSDVSTTFENTYTTHGRVQHTHSQAVRLEAVHVPEDWKSPAIVHIGPIAQEIDPNLATVFPDSIRLVTPQGFLRSWDESGMISPCDWPDYRFILENSDIAILSMEDVRGEESIIEDMASAVKILVVTDGPGGCQVYWNRDVKRFLPPQWYELDATGAGDIFATAYTVRYLTTRDPWESARFATHLAAYSVLRPGLSGIPTIDEINSCLYEII